MLLSKLLIKTFVFRPRYTVFFEALLPHSSARNLQVFSFLCWYRHAGRPAYFSEVFFLLLEWFDSLPSLLSDQLYSVLSELHLFLLLLTYPPFRSPTYSRVSTRFESVHLFESPTSDLFFPSFTIFLSLPGYCRLPPFIIPSSLAPDKKFTLWSYPRTLQFSLLYMLAPLFSPT